MTEKRFIVSHRSLSFTGTYRLHDIDFTIKDIAKQYHFFISDVTHSLVVKEDKKVQKMVYTLVHEFNEHETGIITISVGATYIPIEATYALEHTIAQEGSAHIEWDGAILAERWLVDPHHPVSFFVHKMIQKYIWNKNETTQAKLIQDTVHSMHKTLQQILNLPWPKNT